MSDPVQTARDSLVKAYESLKSDIPGIVKDTLSVSTPTKKVRVNEVWVDDNLPEKDHLELKKRRLYDQSWATPVYADVSIMDEHGKEMERAKKLKIFDLPKPTDKLTFLVDGNEYSIPTQLRLRPGIYSRVTRAGDYESHINLGRGSRRKSFAIQLDPAKQSIKFRMGTAGMPMYSVLKGFGVPDEKIREAWGDALFKANVNDTSDQDVMDFHTGLFGKAAKTAEEAKSALQEHFIAGSLDPATTAITLGKPHDRMNGDALLDASTKLLHVSQQKIEADDRDSLRFKTVHTYADLVKERLIKNAPRIQREMTKRLQFNPEIRRVIDTDKTNKLVKGLFTSSNIKQSVDGINPLQTITNIRRTTILGEGAIGDSHAISIPQRDIHASYMGHIDPSHTPESSELGVVNHLAINSRQRGNTLETELIDAKTGEHVWKSPHEMYNLKIAFPGEFKRHGKAGEKTSSPGWASAKQKVNVMHQDKISETPSGEVTHFIADPTHLFDVPTNTIPFVNSESGARAMMGAKMQLQALSLIDREAPFVQPVVDGVPLAESIGKYAGHTSPVSGKIESIEHVEDKKHGSPIKALAVTIRDDKGKKHTINLPDHLPTNSTSFDHAEMLVKPGDKVKAGQIIADSPFTRNGKLAIGKNMRVAYMPYHGFNFEDGIVISESAAKKFSSQHLNLRHVPVYKEDIISRDAYQTYFPGSITRAHLDKLDKDGVIKPGSEVKPGDILAAVLRKKHISPEDAMLGKLSRSLVQPYKDGALKWDEEDTGVVTDVAKTSDGVKVYIKTIENMKVGDKLCYDEKTEILTNCGWKFFKDLIPGDMVCSLDEGIIKYEEPSAIHHYESNEDMYRIKNQQIDFLVTKNHNMFVRKRDESSFGLVEAKNIFGKRVEYSKSGKWLATKYPTEISFPAMRVKAGQGGRGERMLPEIKMDMDDYMFILGAFLSEGSVFGHNLDYYGIVISQTKPDGVKEFSEEAKKRKIKFSRIKTGFNIYSKQLFEYFKQFGKCYEKRIPNWVFCLPQKNLETLFKWMMWGDGHTKNGHPVAYTTTSKILADDFQRLCLHIGIAANIAIRRAPDHPVPVNGIMCMIRDAYYVRIVSTKLTPAVNHSHVNKQKIQKEGFVKYDGVVHCVTVSCGIVYVRRNGKPAWSGNSGLHGNKGIVTLIVPDHEIPHDSEGKPLEVILNPAGIPSRTNPSQLLEGALGKIAEKTGQTYKIVPFANDDNVAFVRAEQKRTGIDDKEAVRDPKTGKVMGRVHVGRQYIMKLDHPVRKKFSARSIGPNYTMDMRPSKGGGEGAQGIGPMETYTMLSHGGTNNLLEMTTLKSERNDEAWRALIMKQPMPPPKPSFTVHKLVGYLKGMGINVEKNGSMMKLAPMDDHDTKLMSNGELTSSRLLRGKDLSEERGGLFDPVLTGGHGGKKWSHFSLPEKFPNPVFEPAIRRLLHIDEEKFHDLIAGRSGVDTKTGQVIPMHPNAHANEDV